MIMKAGFVDELRKVKSPDEVYKVIDKYSENKEKTVVENTYTSETTASKTDEISNNAQKDFIVA